MNTNYYYWRNISNLRYADDTTLMAESEEELKSSMKVKEENEKVGLKLTIQKTKIMASAPITSWEIDGETVSDFIFWAPKALQMVTSAMKLKDSYSFQSQRKAMPKNAQTTTQLHSSHTLVK